CASGWPSSISLTTGAPASVTTPISRVSSVDQMKSETSATLSWNSGVNVPVSRSSVPMAGGALPSSCSAYTVPSCVTWVTDRCLPSDAEALSSFQLPPSRRYSSLRSSYSPLSSLLEEQMANRGSLRESRVMEQFSLGARARRRRRPVWVSSRTTSVPAPSAERSESVSMITYWSSWRRLSSRVKYSPATVLPRWVASRVPWKMSGRGWLPSALTANHSPVCRGAA